MNRTKKTLVNAIANVTYLLVSGLSGLIVMRVLLTNLGSDYNGLNSTVAQVMMVLSLVSSSFTTASLVSLYKPYNESDWELINLVLATSRRVYRIIGLCMLVVGSVVCFGYSLLIKSNLRFEIVLSVMLLGLISAVFNVGIVNVFRLVFQVSQTEYVVTFIQVAYVAILTPVACFALIYTKDIVIVRTCYVLLDLCSGLGIILAAKRLFSKISFVKEFDYSLTRGTKDVFITSLTGIVYRTAPTLFLSTFVGTLATSVYYVYDSVVSIIRNIVQVCIQSPKNAFGQILHDRDEEKIISVFRDYEYTTIAVATALLSTTYVLILPFVGIYVGDVNDANYQDGFLAAVLIAIAFFEVSHIPSGLAIQLSGEFKLAKGIQYSALVLLVMSLIALGWIFGLHGIVIAVLFTAVWLAGLEVFFARKRIINLPIVDFLLVIGAHFVLLITVCAVERMLLAPLVLDIVTFIIWGAATLTINIIAVCILGRFVFRQNFASLMHRITLSVANRR